MTQMICDMPTDERPRERMMMHGAPTLSMAELFAIVVGSGKRGKNALDISRHLLSDGLQRLAQRDVQSLATVPGIGKVKAARIIALFEFARRMAAGLPEDPPDFDHHTVGASLVKKYGRLYQERLGAIVLDSRHRILAQREIFIGTIDHAFVSTGDIMKYVLMENGKGVVVYHNHPSGNCAPSAEDQSFTEKLKYSLRLADIEMVDHLIIGAHGFFSMRERGLL